jgi:serine/threonine-protein kinase HipA
MDLVPHETAGDTLEQLFAMVALSCAVENGDAHLKNFAVLYEHPEAPVRLAPAYDIISTTLYLPRDVLALTLDGSKQFPDRKRLVGFGRRACGLTEATTRELLDRVRSGVERAMADIRRYASKHAAFAQHGERLITTFRRGLARLH